MAAGLAHELNNPAAADLLSVAGGLSINHTDWLGETVLRDEHGFIVSGPDLMRDGCMPSNCPLTRAYLFETSVPGIFVAGDHGTVPSNGWPPASARAQLQKR
jgi:thioredoxin reductase